VDGEARALIEGAERLCDSAEAVGWRGPDAYDGLWWRWPRPLVGGRRRRQVLMQLHARSPFDFRPLYRRSHPLIPKALGIFASARTRLHGVTGDPRQRAGALGALEALCADHSSGTPGWGYHWDMQTRWSFYPAGSPNIVVTAFAAAGLREAADAFAIGRYDARARAATEWIQDELFLDGPGIYCYHHGSEAFIHNANLLGARIVQRVLGPSAAPEAVGRAVERTVECQKPDGSWPYGEGGGLEFVDSFHTGYVLECLCDFADADPRVREALERGSHYYAGRFFGDAGEARLWPDRRFPEDAHAAGTALTSLARLAELGLVDPELVRSVGRRATAHMLRDGHAIYRRYRAGTTKVRYLRWADAHMALGLANAAVAATGPSSAGQPDEASRA
jgi:hypothetical protein